MYKEDGGSTPSFEGLSARSHVPHSPAGQGYRAEIDGLRAFAVLSVLCFHLERDWLPGGFVGVDVFLAISGYVVTKSLVAQPDGTLGSQLSRFYTRRAKRLLPALVVCVVCIALLWALLIPPFPDEINNAIYRTGLAGLLGLSNFYLIRQNSAYFDGESVANPFAHTWSLGVEEQFYLLYPILLLLAGRSGALRNVCRRRLLYVLVLGGASLALSALWSSRQPTWAYYAMPSRFWELGAGSVLALVEGRSLLQPLVQTRRVHGGLQAAGATLLGIGVVVTPEQHFPVPWALVSVVGALLMLATGGPPGSVLTRMLSSRGPVYLGRISYSLYLWHWPVICIVSRTVGMHDGWGVACAVVATAVSAVGSFHLVEQPIRHSKTASGRRLLITAGLALALGGMAVEGLRRGRYDVFRGSAQDWRGDWNVELDTPVPGLGLTGRACHLSHRSAIPEGLDPRCFVSARPPAGHRLFVIGDSHARASWPMLEPVLDEGLYDLYALSHDGCRVQGSSPQPEDSCSAYWSAIHRTLAAEARAGDLVLLAAYLRSYPATDSVRSGIEELARLLRRRGVTLILQAPLPVLDALAYDCLPSWYVRVGERCQKPKRRDLDERGSTLAFVVEVARREDNVAIWDPYDLLCPGATCGHLRQGKPLFRDNDHLASHGARYLAPHFLAFVKNTLAPGATRPLPRNGRAP